MTEFINESADHQRVVCQELQPLESEIQDFQSQFSMNGKSFEKY